MCCNWNTFHNHFWLLLPSNLFLQRTYIFILFFYSEFTFKQTLFFFLKWCHRYLEKERMETDSSKDFVCSNTTVDTRVPSMAVCPSHPLKKKWRHVMGIWFRRQLWWSHGERKSALYTTTGTGLLTFLLMPSHEPCHLNEDMDRCHPVLTPL